jgi:hypothetical protein
MARVLIQATVKAAARRGRRHAAPSVISMIWHAKREGDAGLQWLRGVVRSIVESEMGEISKGAASTSKRRGQR